MPTNSRVMVGVADYTGSEVNGLKIGQMVQRHGPGNEPVYQSECSICKSRSTATQRDLRNASARCRSALCGRTAVPDKSRATELARQVKEREIEAQRLRDEASAARMNAETSDHKVTSSRPPATDDPGPLTERQRIELRAHREELEAVARSEKEAKEAPLKAAQRQLQETANKLAAIERERVSTLKDDAFTIDPGTIGVSVPVSEVDVWNRSQAQEFMRACPGYHPTPENLKVIGDYLARNMGPKNPLVSAKQLTAAYERLSSFGLLQERPAPVVKASPIPRKVTETPKPTTFDGVDLESGEPREYTEREVSRMSSEVMKRCLRLTKDKLSLPNIGPGPHGYR